mgnify:CR=1 FL=1
MSKTTINMMSSATSVKGQGVGSAYIEQVGLVSSELSDKFEAVSYTHLTLPTNSRV